MLSPKLVSQVLPFNSIYEEAFMKWFDSKVAAPKKCIVCGVTEHDPDAADIQDGICDECACADAQEEVWDATMDKWLDEEFGQ